jgi:hypothetical protein
MSVSMNSVKLLSLPALLLAMSAFEAPAFSSELDPAVPQTPEAIIVREDAEGNQEAFRGVVSEETKIENVQAVDELDQVTSTESWYRHRGYGYGHSYRTPYYSYHLPYYGYTYVYNYSPYSSYYSGGYRYYHCQPRYSYRYGYGRRW